MSGLGEFPALVPKPPDGVMDDELNMQPWSRLVGHVVVGAILGMGLCGCSEASATAENASADQTAGAQKKVIPATMELGKISLVEMRPLESSTLRVQFQAYAIASSGEAERLQKILSQRKEQARQQVMIAVRTSETWEFDEPELARLRRRIQLRLNRWLDEPLVEDIALTEFRFRTEF